MAMVKQIEGKRLALSNAIRELISILPGEVKLQSLGFKEHTFTLKGQSLSQTAIESFLKAALSLKYLTDPTPIGISRDKNGIAFELTFRFRPS
jgi:Tfp pilus assembly protein PilN